MIGSTWNFYEGTLNDIIRRPILACFSYKVLGEKKVYAYGLPHFPRYRKDKLDDKALVKKMWEVLDSFDTVIAHNGKSFDLKMANYFFIIHHLKPPRTFPYTIIDTKNEFKRVARFPNNKLDYLSSLTGHGHKMDTGGYSLWKECEKGNMKAWAKMIKYNKIDVLKLEEIYKEIAPWLNNHPNLKSPNPDCVHCGSSDIIKRGVSYTLYGDRPRYTCKKCRKWFTGKLVKRRLDTNKQ